MSLFSVEGLEEQEILKLYDEVIEDFIAEHWRYPLECTCEDNYVFSYLGYNTGGCPVTGRIWYSSYIKDSWCNTKICESHNGMKTLKVTGDCIYRA